jgi:3-phenylpropionate/cinnamic acid dioxygenase small subunit
MILSCRLRRKPESDENAERQAKLCSKCRKMRPFSDYYRGDGLNGLHSRCRSCCVKKSHAYNASHPDRHRDHERSYIRNNPEKARARDVRANLKQYGIRPEDREAMAREQGFRCAICREELDLEKRRTHVDHDHVTGKIRGVLCAHCNAALGYLRDNPNTALACAAYLELHKSECSLSPALRKRVV